MNDPDQQLEESELGNNASDTVPTQKFEPIQFSIKGLLVLTGLAALFFGMFNNDFFSGIIIVFSTCSSFGLTLVALIFGRGWIQAFAIGCAPIILCVCLMIFYGGIFFDMSSNIVVEWTILMTLTMGCGTVSACLRGYLDRRNGKADIPNLPFIRKWFSN